MRHAHLFEGPMPKTTSGSKSIRDINILAAIFCSDPSDVFIKHFDKDMSPKQAFFFFYTLMIII